MQTQTEETIFRKKTLRQTLIDKTDQKEDIEIDTNREKLIRKKTQRQTQIEKLIRKKKEVDTNRGK